MQTSGEWEKIRRLNKRMTSREYHEYCTAEKCGHKRRSFGRKSRVTK